MIRWVLRKLLRATVWAYFRRFEVEGQEHVPATGPVLLVSNHTNALVDPLVIQHVLTRRMTLTAKASLGRNPVLGFFLRSFDVVLFHRPSESEAGTAAAANRAAIEDCQARLARGEMICVFPEGKSHSEPSMLRFKTGAARIARGCSVPPAIVPVGLYYESKETFRSSVCIRFGPALARDPDTESAASLTEAMQAAVAHLAVEYERPGDEATFEWLGRLLATQGQAPPALRNEICWIDHATRLRTMVSRAEDLRAQDAADLPSLEARIESLRTELDALGVTPRDVYLPMRWPRAIHFALEELEILSVGSLVAALGWANNIVPFLATRHIVRRRSKERDQWASNAVFTAVLVYPLCYGLQVLTAALLLPVPWAIAYTLLLPLSGAYYLLWRDRVGRTWRRTRTFARWVGDRAQQQRFAQAGLALIRDVERLGSTSGSPAHNEGAH